MDDEGRFMLDPSVLMRVATGYLARYAASSLRVRQVMKRRIQRRCVAAGVEPPDENTVATAIDATIDRLRQLGLLDDDAFAAVRTRALQRKGLPERRIRMALRGEGLSSDQVGDGDKGVNDDAQALRFAARKRLGPFRTGDRAAFRDKDMRRLLRAGFSFAVAVATVDSEPEGS